MGQFEPLKLLWRVGILRTVRAGERKWCQGITEPDLSESRPGESYVPSDLSTDEIGEPFLIL